MASMRVLKLACALMLSLAREDQTGGHRDIGGRVDAVAADRLDLI